MAGTVMHLVIADRLLSSLSIQNPGYFYCGNLAPDAIMNRENYTREMKRHTHFKDGILLHELRIPEKMAAYRKRFDDFADRFVKPDLPHHEIYLGYGVHMLVDELYILRFRDAFVDARIARGEDPTDPAFFTQFGKDVDRVDLELTRIHSFSHPMPDTLYFSEVYEIPGYVTYKELCDSKNFVVHKNFEAMKGQDLSHVTDGLTLMTMEQNLEFIELCVREIPGMVRERFET